ncbi:MAG: cob(I)yrinic acid a,c-diamide adenosyltransferase [Thermostichales cyanobacterium SZTDM-1c_bins_54]
MKLSSSVISSPAPAPVASQWLLPGTIQLYICPIRGGTMVASTGDVIAQALRVAGQGTPVLVVQFLKGGIQQGPQSLIQMGRYLEWVRCNLSRHVDSPHVEPEEQAAIQELWQFTQEAVASGRYGLVVLDELSLAMKFGLIPEAEVLNMLHQRPTPLDVIITGTDMPESLLALADVITHQVVRPAA